MTKSFLLRPSMHRGRAALVRWHGVTGEPPYHRAGSSRVVLHGRQEQITESPARTKGKKRKLAVSLGYCGTGYNGFQRQNDADADASDTVESVLLRALRNQGFISPEHYPNVGEIAWSRASRTDKGVHAVQTIVTAKLVVDDPLADIVNGNLRQDIVHRLNEELQGTGIHVWAVSKAPKSLNARVAMSWREYEYVLPVGLLTRTFSKTEQPPPSRDEAVARFATALQALEGSHSFHNFTPSKAFRRLRVRAAERQRYDRENGDGESNTNTDTKNGNAHGPLGDEPGTAQVPDTDADAEEEGQGEGEGEQSPAQLFFHAGRSVSVRIGGCTGREQAVGEKWAKRTIYRCELLEEPIVVDGEEFLRVRVRGNSFLMHQVRYIVGTAAALARGAVPRWLLDAALRSEWMVSLPIAAPMGLMKVDAGLRSGPNTHLALTGDHLEDDRAVRPLSLPSAVPDLPPFRLRLDLPSNPNSCQVFMDDTASVAAKQWKESFLYEHIASRWQEEVTVEETNGEDKHVRTVTRAEEFGEYIDSYFWARQDQLEQVRQKWLEERSRLDEAALAKRELKRTYRERSLGEVRDHIRERAAKSGGRSVKSRGHPQPINVSHQMTTSLLPAQFHSDLVRWLQLLPGVRVKSIINVVCAEIIKGNIPTTWESPELFAWLVENGVVKAPSPSHTHVK